MDKGAIFTSTGSSVDREGKGVVNTGGIGMQGVSSLMKPYFGSIEN